MLHNVLVIFTTHINKIMPCFVDIGHLYFLKVISARDPLYRLKTTIMATKCYKSSCKSQNRSLEELKYKGKNWHLGLIIVESHLSKLQFYE